MNQIKVLAICGSLRVDSFNRKLLAIATKIFRDAGSEVEEADLKTLALPVFDQDLEKQALPEGVIKLKKMVAGADVIFFASPEYNRSISGALKNAIDWISRENNLLEGKVAAIAGVSSGPFGTMVGQYHLRQILSYLGMHITPRPQLFVRFAEEAFNQDGSLVDKKTEEVLRKLIAQALDLSAKVKS